MLFLLLLLTTVLNMKCVVSSVATLNMKDVFLILRLEIILN